MSNKQAIEYYQSIHLRIKDFCKPLNDYFSIPFFMYYKLYKEDKSYTILSNDIDTAQEYYLKINNDKFYCQSYLTGNDNKILIWPDKPMSLGMQIYFDKGYWNGITFMQENSDSFENYSFVSYKDNCQINEFFSKHYKILEKFVDHFKVNFVDVISNSAQCKAKYKNGFDLYLPEHLKNPIPDIRGFLESIGASSNSLNVDGQIIQLTKREMQCLELVDKGHSAKLIGKELLLSPKTIENHINNIRQKTGVHHKHDLIKFYRELFNS